MKDPEEGEIIQVLTLRARLWLFGGQDHQATWQWGDNLERQEDCPSIQFETLRQGYGKPDESLEPFRPR